MIKEMILSMTEQGKNSLERTFAAVPDDKINWKPLDLGRTALDAFSEAAQTLGMVAQLIESRGEIKPSRELFGRLAQERAGWSRADALSHMELNFSAFKAHLEGLTEEEFALPVTLPMGGGMTAPLGGWAMMAYRALISRFAQINYIQTLYGDNESH